MPLPNTTSLDLTGIVWRKSSRSQGGGVNCVEVGLLDGLTWRKSRRSQGGGANCVECASMVDGRVAVRDSKRPEDAVLVFSPRAWRSFVDGTKAGAFDR